MEFTMATKDDLEQLIEMRIAYLREDVKEMTEKQEEAIRGQLLQYFKYHLGNDILGFIVKSGNVILSTALLLIIHKPANPKFITGKVGDVLNVYTRPEYRHQGMAKALIKNLLNYAKEQQLDYVELSATEDGYPLYKALGFEDIVSSYHPMKYKIREV